MACRTGALGIGLFDKHDFHKKEKEDIVRACGLKIEYGEPTEVAKDMGTFKGVTSEEHTKMIQMYVEGNIGMSQIASELGRSSRTILIHIHAHNGSIQRSGFCPTCKRASSPYQNQKAERLKSSQVMAEEG